MINAFFLISLNRLQAQTSETKLNQIDLMKQMVGSWKCNIAKDTTAFWDAKSYGTGLEVFDKFLTRGKIVIVGKELFGFDKSIDKYIIAGKYKGKEIGVYVFWFTSIGKYKLIPYGDISNPEKASFKIEGEFKSLDIIVETEIVNSIPVKTDTWVRVRLNNQPEGSSLSPK